MPEGAAPGGSGPGFAAGCLVGGVIWGALVGVVAAITLALGALAETVGDAVTDSSDEAPVIVGAGPGGVSPEAAGIATSTLVATLAEEYFIAQQVLYASKAAPWRDKNPDDMEEWEVDEARAQLDEYAEDRKMLERRYRDHLQRAAVTCGPNVLALAVVEPRDESGGWKAVLSSRPLGLLLITRRSKMPVQVGGAIRRIEGTLAGEPFVAYSRVVYDRYTTGGRELPWTAWVLYAGG